MPLINSSVSNLIQGVSQQPDAVRFPGQCAEQENALSSVVDGLQKRPATQHVATLLTEVALDANAKVHFIERDNNERYVVIIKGTDNKTISAYNLTTGKQTRIDQKYRGLVNSFTITNDAAGAPSSADIEITTECPLVIAANDDGTTPVGTLKVVGGGWTSAKRYNLMAVGDGEDKNILKIESLEDGITLFDTTKGELQSVIEYTITGTNSDLVLDSASYLTDNSGEGVATLSVTPTVPKDDLSLMTTGDVTYVLNTKKPVSKDPISKTRPLDRSALVFIKQGDYEKKYGVRINIDGDANSPHEHHWYSGASQRKAGDKFFNTAKNAQADTILEGLFSDNTDTVYDAHGDDDSEKEAVGTNNGLANLNANGFTAELLAPQIGKITGPESPNWTIHPVDSVGGEGVGVVHKSVTALTDLPTVAPHRYKVEIAGDLEEQTDNRYVQFLTAGSDETTPDGEIGQGSWYEIGGANIPNHFNINTMPLMLRSTAENVFELGHMPLDGLLAGDDNTNPDPSFVGSAITGVFSFKGRLGFLSGASVSLTEVKFGSYDALNDIQHYNFYRTSVASLLDNDTIDVTVSSAHVVNLRNAVPFQDNLVMFSEFGQFVLRGGDLLTIKTVSANPITEYECDSSVAPVSLGSYIYFPFRRGSFTGVREFTMTVDRDVYDANEVTSHVPQYIPTNLVAMSGAASEELLALTDGTAVYIYKYFFSGNEKILSSWSKFTISGGGIRGLCFVDADLFIVQAVKGQTHLLKMPLENKYRDPSGFNTHLDRRVEREFKADATEPTIVVPYLLAEGETFEVYTKDGLLLQNTKTTVDGSSTLITFKDGVVSGGVPVTLDLATSGLTPSSFPAGSETGLDLNTGLWTQTLSVTNNGSETVPSFNIFVTGLPAGVTLYNADGEYGGRSFITNNTPLAAGATIGGLTLKYFQPDTSGGFTPQFSLGVPGNEVYVGIPYLMKYTFSEQFFGAPSGDKLSPTNVGRKLIRNGSIFFTDTSHFVVKVTPDLRDTSESAFNATIVQSTVEGSMPLETNSFRFPVFTDPKGTTITIENATAAPCNLQSAEFESFVHQRSRRYG